MALRLMLVSALLHAAPSAAQTITPSGLNTAVNEGGGVHEITGGTRSTNGRNLFHSFGLFSIDPGQTALFVRPPAEAVPQNILGRVTGGQVSSIFGTIDSSQYPGANLFMINPAGWVFGPGASLNVGGSFHASSATHLRFPEGMFCAGACPNPQPEALLISDPVAFGFLGPTGSIAVDSAVLAVEPAATLSVVGGDVQVSAAFLMAPGGRIRIASVASAGEIAVDDLTPAPGTRLGGVVVNGGSFLDVSSDPNTLGPSGVVSIRGGQLVVDGALMLAINLGDLDGESVAFDLQGQEAVGLTNGAALLTFALGAGRGGDIRIAVGDGSLPGTVEITNGALLLSQALGTGRGGDVRLTPLGSSPPPVVQITNGALLASVAGGLAPGGDIVVEAGTVNLADAAQLFLAASDEAMGGTIALTVANALLLDGGAQILSSVDGNALGGSLLIEAGALQMTGASSIARFTSSTLPGGAVTLDIAGHALLSGVGTAITSASFFTATAAPVVGRFGSLTLQNGALIQGGLIQGTEGTSVTLTAAGPISITNGSGISSQANIGDVGPITVSAPALIMHGGFISSVALNTGRAGDIVLDLGTLSLTGGAQIASSNSFAATGAGGDIVVKATGPVTIAGASSTGLPVLPAPFGDFIADPSSGIFSTAASLSPQAGPAGTITLTAPTVLLTDGGQISVATLGAGAGGNIEIAADVLRLAGGARIDSSTIGAGSGGTIAVAAALLDMADGAAISVATSGMGNAGDIALNVGALDMRAGARIDSGTTNTGAGGTIEVTASDAISVTGESEVASMATAMGPGGTIVLAAPRVAVGDGGRISVATSGSGAAGDVRLTLGTLDLATNGRIDSGTTGAGGGGTIDATVSDAITIASGATLTSTASATGPGGIIRLSTPRLVMADNGTISVATSGSGRAGDIVLDIGTLDLGTGARIDSGTTGAGAGGTIRTTASGGLSIAGDFASNAEATGPGGDITLTAARVFIGPGGTISARSTGTAEATAGSITINAGNAFEMLGSRVTTEAIQADGGNIVIQALEMVRLTDSAVTTSVQSGVGAGGNITIDPVFVILSGSEIRADAFGGPGGNITIVADVFLSAFSLISASSQLSTPGTIDIQARVTDISGTLAELPSSVLQAVALLQASCATRLAEGRTSSFVVAGREGLPAEPGGILPSPLLALDARDVAEWVPDGPEEAWPIVRWAMALPRCSR